MGEQPQLEINIAFRRTNKLVKRNISIPILIRKLKLHAFRT